MRALFRRLVPRPAKPTPTIVTAGGSNSLLEFRSEHEPLVAPPPLELVKPQPPQPFRMDRHKAPHPALPALLFILMIAASVTIVILWWFQARQGPIILRANGPEAAPAADTDAKARPAAPSDRSAGGLDVTSDPPGARVSIDGTPRGRTPLLLTTLSPGRHEIAISAGGTTINRTVTVVPGATATVMASVVVPTPRPEVGWVSIEMPFEAEILEQGRLLGTTASPRLALPPGSHDLQLRNSGLGFDQTVGVQVVAGQTVRPGVNAPTGLVSINALPWAEVLIDGRSVGTTPLANLPVEIGTHTVTLKHPTLGERRQTISVTGGTPIRVGVSLEP